MPRAVDLGINETLADNAGSIMALAVHPGDTITIANASTSSTVNFFSNLTSTAAGTIAASASQNFTAPAWLQSQGRSSLLISGGIYGS